MKYKLYLAVHRFMTIMHRAGGMTLLVPCKSCCIYVLLTLRVLVFSTSDRYIYQMCYCYRKLDFMTKCGRPCAWEAEFGRPWEAMLPSLAQTDHIRSESQSGEHGLPRPPKFGLPSTRPPTFCHVICLCQSDVLKSP